MKKAISLLLAALMTAAMLVGCTAPGKTESEAPAVSSATTSETPVSSAEEAAVIEIGEGSTVFAFEATDSEGTVTRWNVHTDETVVGKALFALGLIDGENAEYGLMVNTVNGKTVDYNTDKAFWAFLIDGEFASAGVDSTNIEQGKTYAFVYTKG